MSENRTTGYDLPDSVVINFPDLGYWEKSVLAKHWRGAPSDFDASAAYVALASKYRRMETLCSAQADDREKITVASVLVEFVAENWHDSSMVASDWANGDPSDFDSWITEFECSYSFAEEFIRRSGDADEILDRAPGGGGYGITAYRYGALVVAVDTEQGAYYFPAGTEAGPDVADYAERADD